MAAKKEINNTIKELKVHKIEIACGNMQKAISLLQQYSPNRYAYTVPAQGG